MSDDGFIDAASNPAAANAAFEALSAEDEDAPSPVVAAKNPPVIADYSGGPWRLPGGVYLDNGEVTYEFEVKELTGRDEVNIAKAEGDPVAWNKAVLAAGVKTIGRQPVTSEMLDGMLVGDRDYMMLAISEATYGEDLDLGSGTCPNCEEKMELKVKYRDIPVRRLSSPSARTFEVPLRRGRKAHVRLPVGSDQEVYLDGQDLTDAERNSVLLRRIVGAIEDEDGNIETTAGFGSKVDALGIVDRRAILAAVDERAPGPQYSGVEVEHECGFKGKVVVGLMSLFPGL